MHPLPLASILAKEQQNIAHPNFAGGACGFGRGNGPDSAPTSTAIESPLPTTTREDTPFALTHDAYTPTT
jgi:hypothetical protein